MTAYDTFIAGYSSRAVRVKCPCGEEWDGLRVAEYGIGWLEPREDCAKCGSTELEVEDLDEQDIQERRLEARGEDF